MGVPADETGPQPRCGLADAKKDAVGKPAHQGAADLRHDRRKSLWVVKDSAKSLFNAEYEVTSQARPDVVVPGDGLSQIAFGQGRDNQYSRHLGDRRRRLICPQGE